MIWTAIIANNSEISVKVFSASNDASEAWGSAKERYSINARDIIALIPGNHSDSVVADGDTFKRLNVSLCFDL